MIFPLAIVWRVRLNLKKKLYLSAMFMLSLFTVAMAIIRCTSGYTRVASDYTQSQNSAWSWFWMEMELFVCKCSINLGHRPSFLCANL